MQKKLTSSSTEALSYSLSELPALTGLGRTSIFDAISGGRLQARKLGRRTVILKTDLESFLHNLETSR